MSNANHKQNHADDQDNEISLVVGSLFNYSPAEDRESYEEEREWVQQLQDSLRQEGVIIDLMTNPGVQIWEGGIRRYGDLYRLSQAAAYIEHGKDITSLLNNKFTEEEDLDPILKQIIEGDLDTQYPHFIKHDGDPFFYPSSLQTPSSSPSKPKKVLNSTKKTKMKAMISYRLGRHRGYI